MIITLDIDGVIANIQQEFIYRLKKDMEIETSSEDWNKHHRVTIQFPQVPEAWVDEQFKDPAFYLNAVPYEDSWYMTNKWFMEGHDVYFVTCRGPRYNKKAVELTERWLDEWEINYNKLYHSETRLEKYKTCVDLNADFLVEDDSHEVSVSSRYIPCYLLDHPYNRDYDIGAGARIKSLRELDDLVSGKELELNKQ